MTNVARRVEPDEIAPADRVRLARWVSGGDDRLVAISTDVVSGRRVVASPPTRMAMRH